MEKTILAVLGVSAVLLAGCSSSDGSLSGDGSPTTLERTPTHYIVPSVEQEPVGPLQAEYGMPFSVVAPTGEKLGVVTILDVEISPTCATSYGPVKPADGTYVAVQLQVETAPSLDSFKFMRTTNRDFQAISPSGTTRSVYTQEGLCLADRDGFAELFQPARKYEGWVLLDVGDPASQILYLPQNAPVGTSAWTLPVAA
ncbi:hypothetical protein [Rhodococcus qingshengii]|jgi:hypothetical protein|nr:hypothetical protein AWH04_09020 [Rhodococcus erythropolis]